jgi:hypothetical protein
MKRLLAGRRSAKTVQELARSVQYCCQFKSSLHTGAQVGVSVVFYSCENEPPDRFDRHVCLTLDRPDSGCRTSLDLTRDEVLQLRQHLDIALTTIDVAEVHDS